ncbi:MAG: hypothetical protein AAGG51_06360 [Cyanobacteria bacterium P01_G01_bin.54]
MAEDKRAIFTQKIATGFLLLLFFSLSLIALDYSIALSLFLGLIGAGSGIFIVTWWYNDQSAAAASGASQQTLGTTSRSHNRKRTNAPDVITAQKLRQDAEQERKKQQKQPQGTGKQRSIITALFNRFR